MLWAVVGVALIGCQSKPPAVEVEPDAEVVHEVSAPPGVYESHHPAGRSVEGRLIDAHVLGDGADVTLIIATIHGNESAGTPLVYELMEHLRGNPAMIRGRRVVIMPIANPDALAARSRGNVHDVDINRNFPAENREDRARFGFALSEPESRAILNVIDIYRPDRIVSIHQPLNCIDYDGPAKALAEEMARHCDLPVKKLGARPGSLGAHAGVDRNLPIITLELPRAADELSAGELWERYGAALLAAVTFGQGD